MSISDIRNNGLNPLSYLGVQSYSPVPLVVKTINPTPNDSQNFTLGSMWLNKITEQYWSLVNLDRGIATWVEFTGGSGTLMTLTGNSGGAVGPTAGNINVIVGANNGTVSITGNPATSTLTLNFSIPTDNTGVGGNSLGSLTSGEDNTAFGSFSQELVTSGSANTSIGAQSLGLLLSGSNNIAVGFQAGLNYDAGESDNILIGNEGVASENNVMRLGTQGSGVGEINTTFIAGVAGVTVSSPAFVTVNTSTGQFGSTAEGGFVSEFITNPATGTAIPAAGVITLEGTGGTTVTTSGSTIVINSSGGGGSGTVGTMIGAGEPGGAIFLTTAATWFAPFGTNSSSKAQAQYSCPTAGTISNLYVNIGGNGSTNNNTVTINKNGTNTTMVATVPSGTTGVFTDLTHSFTVVAGDTIQFECTQASTGVASGTISAEFTAAGAGSGTVTSVVGGNNITITGTPTVTPIVNVSGTTNHDVQIGNASGSLTSVANGTTGQVLTAQTGADPIWATNAISGCILSVPAQGNSFNVSRYYGFFDNFGGFAALTNQMITPAAGTISNLYIIVETNSDTANGIVTLNVNGSNTALTVTVPGSTAGTFSDTTHSVSVNAGDLLCLQIAPSGGSGNIAWASFTATCKMVI